MNINVAFNQDEIASVCLTGKLGVAEAEMFSHRMSEEDISSARGIYIDCSDLEYITSAGLRELIILKKRSGSKPFKLKGVSPVVAETLDIAGFSSILDIERERITDFSRMNFREFLDYKAESDGTVTILQDTGGKYTWQEIWHGARVIAADLARQGVHRGSHVAICSANSLNWVLTFFAVQELGAVAVLMNFKLEIPAMLDIANATDVTHYCYGKMPAVKDKASFAAALTDGSTSIRACYDMSPETDFLSRPDPDNLPVPSVDADDLALMIFTSGSTGRPKAVMLSAFNVLHSAKNIADSISMNDKDVNCMVSPMFHISGLGGGMFTNMIYNTRIVLPASVKPEVIIPLIEQEGCTIFNCVPTVMFSLIQSPLFAPEKLKTLRYSRLSGAPVTKAQFDEIRSKLVHVHLAASYGMTEIAPITSTDYEDTADHITGTIGKPFTEIEVKIVDPKTREECPVGVAGEICARGYNLLTAYYKLEADQQPVDDDGWMKTGDLGFFDEEGYIHFTGRLKNLIIRGGENIAPGDITSVISELENVADARAFGIPDEKMGELVGAAVLMRDGEAFDETVIRLYAEAHLPRYEWPVAYVGYAEFPHLANGKVDEVSLKKNFLEKIK